MGGATYTRVIK